MSQPDQPSNKRRRIVSKKRVRTICKAHVVDRVPAGGYEQCEAAFDELMGKMAAACRLTMDLLGQKSLTEDIAEHVVGMFSIWNGELKFGGDDDDERLFPIKPFKQYLKERVNASNDKNTKFRCSDAACRTLSPLVTSHVVNSLQSLVPDKDTDKK